MCNALLAAPVSRLCAPDQRLATLGAELQQQFTAIYRDREALVRGFQCATRRLGRAEVAQHHLVVGEHIEAPAGCLRLCDQHYEDDLNDYLRSTGMTRRQFGALGPAMGLMTVLPRAEHAGRRLLALFDKARA